MMASPVDDADPAHRRPTSAYLGAFYRELIDEGLPEDAALDLTRMAAEEILPHGLCVKPEPEGG